MGFPDWDGFLWGDTEGSLTFEAELDWSELGERVTLNLNPRGGRR